MATGKKISAMPEASSISLDNYIVASDNNNTYKMKVVEVLKGIYPIGAVYMNVLDNTNPAILLGFGTWTRLPNNYYLYNGSDAPLTTGGELTTSISSKTTTGDTALTIAQMASHTHTTQNDWDCGEGWNGGGWWAAAGNTPMTNNPTTDSGNGTAHNHDMSHTHELSPSGISVNAWRRIS